MVRHISWNFSNIDWRREKNHTKWIRTPFFIFLVDYHPLDSCSRYMLYMATKIWKVAVHETNDVLNCIYIRWASQQFKQERDKKNNDNNNNSIHIGNNVLVDAFKSFSNHSQIFETKNSVKRIYDFRFNRFVRRFLYL